MDRNAVLSLWEAHKEERWPQVGSQHEGPLMTLDTVISGCVVYFLDSPEGLMPSGSPSSKIVSPTWIT